MSARRLVMILALGAAASGCAAVKPWQREKLAAPVMEAAFVESPLEIGYRAKVVESKTGGGLPGTASGGGCGCTQ
jgi:hypothetical protein